MNGYVIMTKTYDFEMVLVYSVGCVWIDKGIYKEWKNETNLQLLSIFIYIYVYSAIPSVHSMFASVKNKWASEASEPRSVGV